MITYKTKEGVPENYFVLLFAQSGSHQTDMSVPQYKTTITNRKNLDGIRYHHGLGEGLFCDNLTTPKSFLAYGKNVSQSISFLFRLAINAKILVIDCYCKSSPRMQTFGKGYSSSSFMCV